MMRRLIAAVVVFAAVVPGVTACSQPSQRSQPATVAHEPAPALKQTVLPFTGLNGPYDVAVDAAGNVFVSDAVAGRNPSNRVIELPAGSSTQRLLPFTRAKVMADPAGEVWVIDGGQIPSRLVKLAHGDEQQSVLPLPDLGRDYRGVIQAVDAAGVVYGMNGGGQDSGGGCCLPVQVAKEAPGSSTLETLPFQHMDIVAGMAADAAGNLYVGDGNRNRVLKLDRGASRPTELPFDGLRSVIDIAVGAEGAVYVVDGQRNQVLKLGPGSNRPTVLPFTGLKRPLSVAIGAAGEVYVVDGGSDRIVKLEGA